VGAPRASLFNNLQPFFGVLFAILLLSEKLQPLEIAGGLLIFAGIALERIRRRPLVADAVTGGGDASEPGVREAVGP
jgi:drug/metabolite transporter (DMT)-like permease